MKWRLALLIGVFTLLGVFTSAVQAAEFSSSNFKIDGVLGGSYSGAVSSTSYGLAAVGGESIVGNGSGGSYMLGQGYTSHLQQSLQLNVQPANVIGYFPLDEAIGTRAYDASANNNPLAFSGTPTWTTGKLGGGITTSSGNTLSSVSNPSYSYSALSVCSWAKITTVGTNPTIVSQSDGGVNSDNMWSLGFGSTSSTPKVYIKLGGTLYSTTSSSSLGTGNWGHICFTYNGVDLKIYVNGLETGSTTINQAVSATSGVGLYIGARTASNTLEGSVDEVKIFSAALSDDEVRNEYDAQLKNIPSSLSLGEITPGTSKTADYDAIVQTDAPGYSLAVNQNHDLSNGGNGAAATYSQDFDGFSNGTTLTTVNTSFDNFSVSGSGTFTASTSAPLLHSTYGRMSTTTSSTFIARKDYASTSERYYRFYMRLSSIPAATQTIFSVRGAGSTVSNLRLQSDGTVILRDGVIGVDTSTTAMTANKWTRFELYYNSTTQRQVLRIYHDDAKDGTAPSEVLTGSATNGATDDVQIGLITSQASQNLDIDDFATGTSGWFGPAADDTIPAISSGSIATPVAWSEGSTKGLGFTLLAAPSLDIKWGSGANYAAYPGSSTTFFTRSGYLNGAKDTVEMRTRLDVATTQPPGGYQNTVTIVGTSTP
ncbi:TPA: hypothetical protein DIV49_01515 [Candidatus Saccharibacteria bacterium]|nr:hypothetical protein [Candidatus Saccharibacteria bacterium]